LEELTARIERVLDDLLHIREDLTTGAAWERDRKAEPQNGGHVDLATIRRLKSQLDEMRQFLWWLLRDVAASSGVDPDATLQNFRLERATEMLRTLQAEAAQSASLQEAMATPSFVDVLQSFATTAVDRHMAAELERAQATPPNSGEHK
jgi:hypothetical protein